VCVCVCVCVERERARERTRESERASEREDTRVEAMKPTKPYTSPSNSCTVLQSFRKRCVHAVCVRKDTSHGILVYEALSY
jgi:hypothetical protein